ncbi:hypothetical protein RF11_10983 [Thelohanellus kitauei]|uniref:Uncharacterized protein n=1 Tax=Thelohanellus kitauei TaxID=669202 RepID=A0A0C2M1V9_THEKT|nr:hypothetical protein RF11_10983 [Thelohanellus kitauei]
MISIKPLSIKLNRSVSDLEDAGHLAFFKAQDHRFTKEHFCGYYMEAFQLFISKSELRYITKTLTTKDTACDALFTEAFRHLIAITMSVSFEISIKIPYGLLATTELNIGRFSETISNKWWSFLITPFNDNSEYHRLLESLKGTQVTKLYPSSHHREPAHIIRELALEVTENKLEGTLNGNPIDDHRSVKIADGERAQTIGLTRATEIKQFILHDFMEISE